MVDDSGGLACLTGNITTGTGSINIRTVGNLSQSQVITSAATGDAIVLSTTGNYSNTSGASALSAANGRWLVYSSMPSLNAFGGLLSGNGAVYNATYTANLPATIGAGNRYVFSQQPTAVITANGQTRVYDGATNFAPVTHTVTGLIDASLYGNVFNQDILTGSLAVTAPGKNVGTYAIGIGSLTAPTGYAVNFTPASATVTAKPLTINAVTDSRVYNGTTSSAGGPTHVGLVGGDTITGLSQAYTSKNVLGANGSTLQVTGYTISDGNLGSNYSVTVNNAAGTITPAPLTVSTSSITRQYDSTTTALGTPIATAGTLFGGDTLSGGTFAFVSKNVGTNVTVNASGITVNDGNSGNNYTLTQCGQQHQQHHRRAGERDGGDRGEPRLRRHHRREPGRHCHRLWLRRRRHQRQWHRLGRLCQQTRRGEQGRDRHGLQPERCGRRQLCDRATRGRDGPYQPARGHLQAQRLQPRLRRHQQRGRRNAGHHVGQRHRG